MAVNIQDILNSIGEGVSGATNKIISFLANQGIITSPTTSKILSILLILLISYLILHFASSLKTPVKILIYILSGILIVSIASTFIS